MIYEEARAYLFARNAIIDGVTLGSLDTDEQPYLSWGPGDRTAMLDGWFTADDLEAIAAFMRGAEGKG